ncbi:hypothetical protein C0081_14570 [Cohaesibacter celericrescens]|uniref:Uncharacterized protein n=1 Tax=Cohaesibacter celericrescens TaxID=2067669 RepID=A0A2N5XNN8_9HYPH|nr:hypothetical protein C0081_14570 [Cohaesibacter celericrescens]
MVNNRNLLDPPPALPHKYPVNLSALSAAILLVFWDLMEGNRSAQPEDFSRTIFGLIKPESYP